MTVRLSGGLRRPAMVTVEQRVLDETRLDLAGLRHDAITACDYLEPRLSWMHPVSIELGPQVEQTVAGCLFAVSRLRKQAAG